MCGAIECIRIHHRLKLQKISLRKYLLDQIRKKFLLLMSSDFGGLLPSYVLR